MDDCGVEKLWTSGRGHGANTYGVAAKHGVAAIAGGARVTLRMRALRVSSLR